MSRKVSKSDKKLLPDELDVNVLVRDDVAVLSLGAGFDSDRAAAAGLKTLLHGEATTRCRSDAPSTWKHGDGYLLSEHLFLHVEDLPSAISTLRARRSWVETTQVGENRPQFDQVELPERLSGLAPWEHELTAVLRRQAWGQVHAPRNDAAGVIVAVARLYPKENILVVVRNNTVGQAIACELNQRMDRHVSFGKTVRAEDAPLVHIQSLSGLDRSSHDWPVLVFADAESARSETGMRQAVSMPDSLIYAVVSTDLKLDQEDQLRLRVTCGPVVYRLADNPFTITAVTVLSVRAKRRRRGSPRNPLHRKRTHVWHNDPRNQQVTGLAEAFATANYVTLAELGVPVATVREQLQDLGRQPRVAIVVESPEHARRLRRMLPGWHVAAGTRHSDKDWPSLPKECNRTILTLTRALAAGVLADVVIRADGTEQPWTWDLGPHYGLSRDSMIVVDLCDAFDSKASDSSQQRRADYAALGWNTIETTTSRAEATHAR